MLNSRNSILLNVIFWGSFLLSLLVLIVLTLLVFPSGLEILNVSDITTETVSACSSEYDNFCLNGGHCYYSIDIDEPACICEEDYGGQRCEKYLWYT